MDDVLEYTPAVILSVTEVSLDCWLTKSSECIIRIPALEFEIPAGSLVDYGTMKLSDFLLEASRELLQAQEICPEFQFKHIEEVSKRLLQMALGNESFRMEILDPTGKTFLESSEAISYQPMKHLSKLITKIKSKSVKNVVVLSGAGLSCSAGIPDFRTPKTGLYDSLATSCLNLPRPECLFNLEYFRKDPIPFWKVAAKKVWPTLNDFSPTFGHRFIKMVQDKGILLRNYTQNIDGLERSVGINPDLLVEVHGSFQSASCIECKENADIDEIVTLVSKETSSPLTVPQCKFCDGLVKPDIVFFGESLPPAFESMISIDLPKCDLLIVVGTSLSVKPFSSLLERVPKDCHRVLINRNLVGIKDMETSFRFADPQCHLDIFLQGDCDAGFKTLCELLEW